MRLGIRRKLIGTLMLVGLFPLAMSLIVILGGGAALQLRTIRSSYENAATDCANQMTSSAREEIDKLTLLSRLPLMVEFIRKQSDTAGRPTPGAIVPSPLPSDTALDTAWKDLKPTDEPLRGILENPLSERLRVLTSLESRRRDLLATDVHGRLIAASSKTGDYFQADEEWWQVAYDQGRGRIYMSSVTTNPATGTPCVEFVVPVYDDRGAGHRLVGILKDKVDVEWVGEPLHEVVARFNGAGQLLDMSSPRPAGTARTIYPIVPDTTNVRAEQFFLKHRDDAHLALLHLFTNELVLGASPVPLEEKLSVRFSNIVTPHWLVVVSKPSEQAMTPVYKLAVTVALIGAALILVLFVLGVAIANREIIMPVFRLREAIAAVGRGELNVRLLSTETKDPTFRPDELGALAHDFDEMTRQLQRNVNALARSNESRRRFMELAGHELRTPVTYILSACQLAQRQLQQIAGPESVSGGGGGTGEVTNESTTATAARTTAQVAASMGKISAKAQRLSKIIDNLLKLVNSDQFITRLNKTTVDMRSLILQVTSDARPFVQERKQTIAIDIPDNLPTFEGDRDKLEDVLTNLISNAIRFSPDGATIRVAAHKTMGDMLEILIEDAGVGIPQEDITNLFEPFYTGTDIMHHHSGEHEFKSRGIGLGLAIVRRFVEIHGGVVRAHSTGNGTQFQILLPLGKDIIPNPPGPSSPTEIESP